MTKITIKEIKNGIIREIFDKRNYLSVDKLKNGESLEFYPMGPFDENCMKVTKTIKCKKVTYNYAIFMLNDFYYIKGKGYKNNPLPTSVLKEIVKVWNNFEDFKSIKS